MIPRTSIKSGPHAKPIPPPFRRGFKSNMPKCVIRRNSAQKKLDKIQPKFNRFPSKIPNSEIIKVGNKWQCPFCIFTHKCKRQLRQGHMAKHFRPRYKCLDCKNTWHISTMYRQHFLWRCRFCDFKPVQFGTLQKHLKKNHPNKIVEVDPIKGYIDTKYNLININVNWRGREVKLNRVETV